MAITTAGRDLIALLVIGGTATPLNAANAHLGVGDSNTAFSAAHTDLQGASKARKAMDGTFPTNPPSPANQMTWRATYATGDANFAWLEAAAFNAAAAGVMFSRLVQNFGTKTSSGTWQLTYSTTITV